MALRVFAGVPDSNLLAQYAFLVAQLVFHRLWLSLSARSACFSLFRASWSPRGHRLVHTFRLRHVMIVTRSFRMPFLIVNAFHDVVRV